MHDGKQTETPTAGSAHQRAKDLNAYLQLRKAKGYMSVGENDHLRTNLLGFVVNYGIAPYR
jgi:hypothetical protein